MGSSGDQQALPGSTVIEGNSVHQLGAGIKCSHVGFSQLVGPPPPLLESRHEVHLSPGIEELHEIEDHDLKHLCRVNKKHCRIYSEVGPKVVRT